MRAGISGLFVLLLISTCVVAHRKHKSTAIASNEPEPDQLPHIVSNPVNGEPLFQIPNLPPFPTLPDFPIPALPNFMMPKAENPDSESASEEGPNQVKGQRQSEDSGSGSSSSESESGSESVEFINVTHQESSSSFQQQSSQQEVVFFSETKGQGQGPSPTSGHAPKPRRRYPILPAKMAVPVPVPAPPAEVSSEEEEEEPPEPIVYEPRKLSFMISGKNLDKPPASSKKHGSKSASKSIVVNPFVQLFYSSQVSDLHSLETEVLTRTPNPSWAKVFTYIWQNNTGQKWTIKVKSRDPPNGDKILGEIIVDVDKYVAADEVMAILVGHSNSNSTKTPSLTSLLTAPVLQIRKTTPLNFKIYARDLARRDTFNGKSDPYVKCSWRRGPDGTDIPFGKTSTLQNVVDADWDDVFHYDSYQEGTEQYWVFKVMDSDGFSKDEFLGQAFVKVDTFMSGGGGGGGSHKRTIELTNESGGKTSKDRISGSLTVVLNQ